MTARSWQATVALCLLPPLCPMLPVHTVKWVFARGSLLLLMCL